MRFRCHQGRVHFQMCPPLIGQMRPSTWPFRQSLRHQLEAERTRSRSDLFQQGHESGPRKNPPALHQPKHDLLLLGPPDRQTLLDLAQRVWSSSRPSRDLLGHGHRHLVFHLHLRRHLSHPQHARKQGLARRGDYLARSLQGLRRERNPSSNGLRLRAASVLLRLGEIAACRPVLAQLAAERGLPRPR